MCAVLWKTKQAMRQLIGKCSLTHVCSGLSPVGIYISPEIGKEELIDSYTETHTTHNELREIHPSTTEYYSGVGQRHLSKMKGYMITRIKFRLDRYGSPQGHLKGVVLDDTKGIVSESNLVDMSTVPTVYTFIEFVFSSPYLVPSEDYSIAVLVNDATKLTYANHIKASIDGSGTHEGEKIGFKNGIWYYTPTWDTLFYVYGTWVY